MIRKKQITADEALVRLELLCARSEQCTFEVTQKLLRWGISSSDRERIVDSLVDRRFVDDSRYASAYARSKFLFSRWGRKKIRMGLAAKRLARPLIDDAVASATEGEAYMDTLRALMRSKARQMDRPLCREDALKVCRFAMQRGFEWEYVSGVLDELRRGEYGDDDN